MIAKAILHDAAEAHRKLKISLARFDEVAAEFGRTLDVFKVPVTEKEEVLAALAAHKDEGTTGYTADNGTNLEAILL